MIQAIARTAALGTSYGAPTEGEVQLAETLVEALPSMDMVRLVSSGTEAVMGALRVARGFTGRDLIVKMEGGFHGGADYLLVKAGSGLATMGVPDSAGIPADVARVHADRPVQRSRRHARSCSPSTPTVSPPSSSSRWPATWAACRLPRATCRGCAS